MLMKTIAKACFAACILFGTTAWAENVARVPYKAASQTTSKNTEWQQFYAVANNYRVAFPERPEHLQQTLSSQDEQFDMKYDVYVAANNQREVYMVLVAQYPDFVDDSYAELSLETFLNGILHQNAGNQLIFADLVEVQGYKGLDFFIKSSDGVYFKGRAVMAKNQLYLLAMECEVQNYVESNYNYFVNSFQIVK